MRFTFNVVLGLVLGGVLVGLSPASARAQLRIAEVLSAPASDWDGDGAVDTRLDEWIEVVNTGPADLPLDGIFFRDGTGEAWHYGFSGTLPAGGVLLVTGNASVIWQSENGAGSSGLSLNNSGDLLELWSVPETGDPELLDSVSVPSHAAATDRSYALSAVSGTWTLHDGLNPYGGAQVPTGTGCEPSPGTLNTCVTVVPTDHASLGRVKAAYGH